MERIQPQEIIDLVCLMRPNELGFALDFWLSEIECRVLNEMYDGDESLLTPERLLLGYPYGDVYWTHLLSMVDLATGNLESYKISRAMADKAWSYFIRTFDKEKYVDDRYPLPTTGGEEG